MSEEKNQNEYLYEFISKDLKGTSAPDDEDDDEEVESLKQKEIFHLETSEISEKLI